jgi:hypothetical protein
MLLILAWNFRYSKTPREELNVFPLDWMSVTPSHDGVVLEIL